MVSVIATSAVMVTPIAVAMIVVVVIVNITIMVVVMIICRGGHWSKCAEQQA